MSNLELIQKAQEATKKAFLLVKLRDDWKYMGYVGAALLTKNNNIFTGVNLELLCGIGFCAEHNAAAEMIKNGETRIISIVAVTNDNKVIPPCGRCRELLYQIDKENLKTDVIIDNKGTSLKLGLLFPNNWQLVLGM
jgi:cytidine deaminase